VDLAPYMPLVNKVADVIAAKLPRFADHDDLVSDGCLGLVDAAAKFDPERGVKFATYASNRIRGAIIDGIRNKTSRKAVRCGRGFTTYSIEALTSPRSRADDHANKADLLPPTPFTWPDDFHGLTVGLTPHERELVHLYFWDGLTMREIAEREACSQEWICQQIHRAIKTLRERGE
jgi:DNA-directed RNA polymerase specialized sigma subunit